MTPILHPTTTERTQFERARAGETTPSIESVAQREGIDPTLLRKEVAEGRVVLLGNILHRGLLPMGVGSVLSVKVNANIGASRTTSNPACELEKLETALRFGADTVMDLTTGREDIDAIRRSIVDRSPIPVGTVPIYQILDEVRGKVEKITPQLALEVIERQARDGVDYMTIHAGILRDFVPLTHSRVTGIVSRGGAILARWMVETGEENFLYTHFDEICEIFQRYDVTFSLGDSLRPGSIADSGDEAQMKELEVLGELVERAHRKGCQAMVEGPGHVPLDQIEFQVRTAKEKTHGAPLYTLGPLVTDVAASRDHIASAIGAALAGWYGADLLCYVTPKEHLGLPDTDDVREGLLAYKIAAHAADVARQRKVALEWDREMSKARFAFDWRRQFALALDPERAREFHDKTLPEEEFLDARFCSMCGPGFCAMRVTQDERRKSGAPELAFLDPRSSSIDPRTIKLLQGSRLPGVPYE